MNQSALKVQRFTVHQIWPSAMSKEDEGPTKQGGRENDGRKMRYLPPNLSNNMRRMKGRIV